MILVWVNLRHQALKMVTFFSSVRYLPVTMGREQQPLVRLPYTNRKLQTNIDFSLTIDPVASSVLF